MKQLLCPLLLLLLCAGCIHHAYLPPKRPLAGMYPTVMPASDMKHCTALEITEESLAGRLEEMELRKGLDQCGLLPQDLALLRRSLAQRGYAELDARRCQGTILWVAFLGYPKGSLTIAAELADHTVLRKSWPLSLPSPEDATETP